MRVIRRKSWRRVGKKKKVTGQRRKGRVNVMGGLRYNDKKRMAFPTASGDGNDILARASEEGTGGDIN